MVHVARALVILAVASAAIADDFYVMPFDVDPPIEVDADLGEWAQMPNPIELNDPAQVTWGMDDYTGLDDLHGTFHLAWRSAGLYLAANVIDDVFSQPYAGNDIYNGDHVNFLIDLTPQAEPQRNGMGQGQYHFVISPGNFADIAPEVYFYVPEGMPHDGRAQVAAKRTAGGYIVEAFVPWDLLGGFKAQRGKDVNYIVAFSDADQIEAKQQSMMTPTTNPWRYGRHALIPMVLGDGNGQGELPPRTMAIVDELRVPASESQSITFTVDALAQDKSAHLFFRGRVHFDRVGGWVANAMQVQVNGQTIEGQRITNRPREATMMRGDRDTYIATDGHIVLWYAPDFGAVEEDPDYQLIDGIKACEFEFNVDGLLHEGENTITFVNKASMTPDSDRTAILGDVELRIKTPSAAIALAPAPTGAIPMLHPAKPQAAWGALEQEPLRIAFRVGDESFAVESQFRSSGQYEHTRRVIERGEWIEVHDTFTNRTDENISLLQEHACDLAGRMDKLWLSCVWMPSKQGRKHNPGNPTVYASTAGAGVGMIALNDEMKVHHESAARDGAIVLGDPMFVLRPGQTYTAQWAIVPTETPDLWSFVNKSRRQLDVNFTIDINFAALMGVDPVYAWTDQRFKETIENKSANFVVQSIYGPSKSRYLGRNAYSTAFLVIDYQYYRDFHARLRSMFSRDQVQHGIYYHCFIDNYEGNDERFADARKLDASGNHMNYGGNYTYDKLYVPTLDNAFGRETARCIDVILDDIGADGIFWDEFCTSRGEYIYNMWDGCTADIDPDTLEITRLKGSVALLSAGWRKQQVERIQQHGFLLCSGAPHTRTVAQTKYIAFCETGSITYCRGMLLWTPIGLGDHLTERTQVDAYRQMLRQLDHGCLYSWYSTHIIPTHPTLTEHMFPFTPIELHEGVLIGEERIITNRSGLFGWGDASSFDAYVYDRDGVQTDEIAIPRVMRDGQACAEVRIPEGYSVAIVRKNPE